MRSWFCSGVFRIELGVGVFHAYPKTLYKTTIPTGKVAVAAERAKQFWLIAKTMVVQVSMGCQ
jgi:hypothetical protein